jgi:acyl-CoA synthetase (AMP-forming)/AMP-acid ligase II
MRWNNLGDLIDHNLDLDRLAVIDLRDAENPRRYSHRDIDLMAGGVARYLTDLGLPRGTRIAIVSLNRAEFLMTYFGIMRAGFVAVPVNTKVPRETADFVMDDAEIKFAFVDQTASALVRDDIPKISFDDSGPNGFLALIEPAEFKTVVVSKDEVGQMLYTSGSTGRPKGVPLSHYGQLWALWKKLQSQPSPDERYIIAQPLFHMNGLMSAKTVFCTNASVVLLPSFSTKSYIKAMADYKVTGATAVPTMWARVIKEDELIRSLDLSSFKKIVLGSAPMTVGLWDRIKDAFPGITIGIGYGTTEAGPAIFGPHPKGIPAPPISLGYPIVEDAVKIVDGPNENEGVLLMRNPSLMAHYHNLPQQTAKAIRDGWYYSGDVVKRDENGFYFFVGRADDMFVCSGENIYPGEVEKMLERHPLVQQAAVVPLADEERGQVPVAFIVARPDAKLEASEIRTYSLSNGPAYQHPRRIAFVSDLPWAGTNKVDRKALLEKALQLEASHGWSPASVGA